MFWDFGIIDYLIKFAHEPHFNIYDVTYENIADTMTAKNVVSDVGVQSSSWSWPMSNPPFSFPLNFFYESRFQLKSWDPSAD